MGGGCEVSKNMLKYDSAMNTHGKTFVYDFCVLGITG